MLLLKLLSLILLADLATGLFHFYVDKYAVMDSKYLTVSINGLLIHHGSPQLINNQSYWELTKGVYTVGIPLFGFSLFFGFYWELLFFILISAQANMIHKWAHIDEINKPTLVKWLQKNYIILHTKQHQQHHNGKYDGYYCVMTNILNPFFHQIKFWDFIVSFLTLFGIRPIKRGPNSE